MKPFRYMTTILILGAVLLLFAGCGTPKTEVRPIGEDIQGQVTQVRLQTLPVIVNASGSVEPEVQVQVSTRMMGWIKTLAVREGDYVKTGQRLLTIDDADIQAKKKQVEAGIAEAEAIVANAQKTAERFENLLREKSVSGQQFDDVLTALARARAGLQKAEAARAEITAHLGYLDIRAPINGHVTRRMVEVGDLASPGQPLLRLEQDERMKIVARLGEKDINSVEVGDRISVDVTSLDNAVYNVEIARIIPAADRNSRTYDIEAYVVNDGRLRSGMFARVGFTIGGRRSVTIPPGSIIVRGQLRGVFTLDDDGIARLRWVRLGDRIGVHADSPYEVISGLSGGETIVISSAKPLAEGDRVVSRP